MRGKNGRVSAFEWNKYKSDVRFFLVINATFSIASIILFNQRNIPYFSHIVDFLAFLQLLYVFVRVLFRRKIIHINIEKYCEKKPAPIAVWADFFSFGLMFILSAKLQNSFNNDAFTYYYNVTMQIVFCLFSLLPVLNYISFRLQKISS